MFDILIFSPNSLCWLVYASNISPKRHAKKLLKELRSKGKKVQLVTSKDRATDSFDEEEPDNEEY